MDVNWNPWHGCRKYSEGCRNCYVFELDKKRGGDSSIHQNKTTFAAPIARDRHGVYKIAPGSAIWTCFTSDFLLEDADEWRSEAWSYIRARSDCDFIIFTKRAARFQTALPIDWGDGYENVRFAVSVENQKRADERIPIFLDTPMRHRSLTVAPMLERIDVRKYLRTGKIDSVSAGGEGYDGARICDYDWILDLRAQCVDAGVPFTFHQTGGRFVKDGRLYIIPYHPLQLSQARKAGIDYMGAADQSNSISR